MSEGPELDDEVGRPPGHLTKDDGSGSVDSKTYQAGVSRNRLGILFQAP